MVAGDRAMCVGAVSVDGIGRQHVVRNLGGGTAKCCKMFPEAGPAYAQDDKIFLEMLRRVPPQTKRNGPRVYLADSCVEGNYQATRYSQWKLLGRTLSFTVDLSDAGCSCLAAFYLVPMIPVGKWAGACGGDRYCDANYVCDVGCSEIDILEANQHALHATTHTNGDGAGRASGLGGSRFDLSSDDYGPAAKIIDTRGEFRVHAFFPLVNGKLGPIEVVLQQEERVTRPIHIGSSSYNAKLTDDLKAGVTPVMSYWSDASMSWLGGGVCPADSVHLQDACGSTVAVHSMAVRQGRVAFDSPSSPGPQPPPPPPPPPPSPRPPSDWSIVLPPHPPPPPPLPWPPPHLLSPSQSAPHHRHSGRAHGPQHPLRTPPSPPPATDDPFSSKAVYYIAGAVVIGCVLLLVGIARRFPATRAPPRLADADAAATTAAAAEAEADGRRSERPARPPRPRSEVSPKPRGGRRAADATTEMAASPAPKEPTAPAPQLSIRQLKAEIVAAGGSVDDCTERRDLEVKHAELGLD